MKFFTALLFVLFLSVQLFSQVTFNSRNNTFVLKNQRFSCTLKLDGKTFIGEALSAQDTAFFNSQCPAFESDGNFALNINWTGWHAPHKTDNADNPTRLSASDFHFTSYAINDSPKGGKQLQLFFSGNTVPLQVRLTYYLAPEQFWLTKQIAVRDTMFGYHFLRRICPVYAKISFKGKILKKGGFGQPVVLRNTNGSLFYALEYPAAHNGAKRISRSAILMKSGVEVGKKIGRQWIESPKAVLGLTPAHFERLWFDRYLQSQRIHPLQPYVLYNSWYDLRSPAFKNIPAKNIMNEANIMRIIDLIETNFVQKNGIHLNAFVLDDGWDVYASDWVLRPKQFPHGLKPIADRLKKLNTSLGLWFGPTGGYSFRMKRINWMGTHGYEVIAKNSDRNHAMMCVAGKHYSQLLKKRTTDFVKNDGVAFFKWDGIQFSCSESDHGHPIGLYSRRAIMDTVIALCRAVRHENPNTFLNITSGTWLSPWWVKYANQIWMGGGDYGYSDIPSISRRDAAMTYRDITLFQDMKVHKFWFPIANLMTHGIIKGQLQKLGGEQEPIDKFTNNALLYFARGVSMWELYISPDILTDAEWDAIGQSMKWARQNFDILRHTFMIGGNPAKDSVYAYVHFNGSQGILAVRNPGISPKAITIPLSDTLGLAGKARGLVLEQLYPFRWISPRLYKTGDQIVLKTEGYQLSVYRIFPLEKAQRPLPTNMVFTGKKLNANHYQIDAFALTGQPGMLNPSFSAAMHQPGKKAEHIRFTLPAVKSISALKKFDMHTKKRGFTLHLQIAPEATNRLAVLLKTDTQNKAKELPQVKIILNGHPVQPEAEREGSKWAWLKIPLKTKKNQLQFEIMPTKQEHFWEGTIQLWLLSDIPLQGTRLVFDTRKPLEDEILPPLPRPANVLHKNRQLAKFAFRNKGIVRQ